MASSFAQGYFVSLYKTLLFWVLQQAPKLLGRCFTGFWLEGVEVLILFLTLSAISCWIRDWFLAQVIFLVLPSPFKDLRFIYREVFDLCEVTGQE